MPEITTGELDTLGKALNEAVRHITQFSTQSFVPDILATAQRLLPDIYERDEATNHPVIEIRDCTVTISTKEPV